jgi:dTMP kinase
VRGAFLDLAAREPQRYVVLDATRPVEELAAAIAAAVTAAITTRA